MNQSEKSLTENVRLAEGALARENGEFALFGLFQREETAGKWDVVISAPWLTTDRAGIQRIVEGLARYLTATDWLKTASVVPLAPDTDFVQTMTRLFHAEHQVLETGSFLTEGVSIDRAFIITANKHTLSPAEPQLAAA